MNDRDGHLYLCAARDDPLLAAWVSVIDAHGLGHRTDVAPHDWAQAFEELFQLGLVSHEAFNALDWKRVFHRRRPTDRDVDAALSDLASLRQLFSEENCMSKFDLFDHPTNALAPRADAHRGELSKPPTFGQLTPRPPAADDLFAPAAKPAGLEPLSALEPTRRALPRDPRPGLPCYGSAENFADPRDDDSEKEFDMVVLCCGRELGIIYDNGRDISDKFPERPGKMIEYAWYAICPHCNSEHHHTMIQPVPAAMLAR